MAHLRNNMKCKHNDRMRYTDGFHCMDCGTFFSKDSPTYRSGELLSDLWMALSNINADRCQRGLPIYPEVAHMKEKIGIGKKHTDYEAIITEAEEILHKHGKNSNSAILTLD